MNDREFILAEYDGNNIFPYTVTCRASYDNYEKPHLIEAFATKNQALTVAKARHNSGYVIEVQKSVAYTIGK